MGKEIRVWRRGTGRLNMGTGRQTARDRAMKAEGEKDRERQRQTKRN